MLAATIMDKEGKISKTEFGTDIREWINDMAMSHWDEKIEVRKTVPSHSVDSSFEQLICCHTSCCL